MPELSVQFLLSVLIENNIFPYAQLASQLLGGFATSVSGVVSRFACTGWAQFRSLGWVQLCIGGSVARDRAAGVQRVDTNAIT